jgi:hypothetical protein
MQEQKGEKHVESVLICPWPSCSNKFLKEFKDVAVTTFSGKLFQSFTIRFEK